MPLSQKLTNATLMNGSTVDISIGHDGVIESVMPAGTDVTDHSNGVIVELRGLLVLAAPIEPHAHLDKAFLAEVVENPTGDLVGAVQAMRANQDKEGGRLLSPLESLPQ